MPISAANLSIIDETADDDLNPAKLDLFRDLSSGENAEGEFDHETAPSTIPRPESLIELSFMGFDE